jgi:hypothetical protein
MKLLEVGGGNCVVLCSTDSRLNFRIWEKLQMCAGTLWQYAKYSYRLMHR